MVFSGLLENQSGLLQNTRHHPEQVKIVWGRGDLFKHFPMLERLEPGTVVMLQRVHIDAGIFRLLELLFPLLEFRQGPFVAYSDFDLEFYDNHKRFFNQRNIAMSRRLIDLIPPLPIHEDFIVVHPLSAGFERRYSRWQKVNLSGVNHVVVGGKGEIPLLPGSPILNLDFYTLARLLRASKGLLSVDSAVMNLANALAVPSVTIYNNFFNYMRTPNYGYGVVDPGPRNVACWARALFEGRLDFSEIPPRCERHRWL